MNVMYIKFFIKRFVSFEKSYKENEAILLLLSNSKMGLEFSTWCRSNLNIFLVFDATLVVEENFCRPFI